jgi:hypothetical protein
MSKDITNNGKENTKVFLLELGKFSFWPFMLKSALKPATARPISNH